MKTLFTSTAMIFALLLAGLVACGPTGCGTLNPAGAYAGDKVLYDADAGIATSYDLLHTFVKWEYDNRAALAGTPEIKGYADSVRRQAPQWFASAIALRDAYHAAPNGGTRTALQSALAVLRQATTEATRYLAAHRNKTEPK